MQLIPHPALRKAVLVFSAVVMAGSVPAGATTLFIDDILPTRPSGGNGGGSAPADKSAHGPSQPCPKVQDQSTPARKDCASKTKDEAPPASKPKQR